MKRALLAFVVATTTVGAAMGISAGSASAATIVMGTGPALACYQAANAQRSDMESLQTCNSALEDPMLTPRDRAATQNNRGVIQIRRRNPNAAIADFEGAARTRPDMGESFVNRGAALIILGSYAQAIESINRGLELGSDELHEAYYNRAIAHEQTGNLRQAYADYRHALELKPDWQAPQLELQRFSVRGAR